MKKHIYKVNNDGFIKDIYLGKFDDSGKLIEPVGDYITNDLPQPLPFYKPKWTGTKWIEGATREEIDKITKPQPITPTETEILQQRLADVEVMLLEVLFK